MPAFVVVQIEIHDPEAYQRYMKLAPASIARYGGCYLMRGGRVEALEGDWPQRRVAILQFPTYARAKAWHDSPEYAPALALRKSCATSLMLLADGLLEPWFPDPNA